MRGHFFFFQRMHREKASVLKLLAKEGKTCVEVSLDSLVSVLLNHDLKGWEGAAMGGHIFTCNISKS